jgi:p-aminobenzoyl-glutamate transporter AbgT
MKREDVGAVFLFSAIACPVGGLIGFGAGALMFDSWLRSFGIGVLLAALLPFAVFFALIWLNPWNSSR